MKIRPRNIPKFQEGSKFNLGNWIQLNPEYYKWYSSIYPNAQVLQGSPLKQRNDLWNKNQLSSSHYTTDDLLRSAYNNYLYTNDYDARSEDLIRWGESLKDFGTISDRDFVNRYNNQARSIREAREAPQTYNTRGYTDTNRTFRNMFWNRSRQGTNTPLYTIGYLDNIEDIEGTSTWQRRMDRYEKPFNQDTPEGLRNRTFFITRPDGSKIKVYKKLNGDIGLFNDPDDPESPKDSTLPNNPLSPQNNPNQLNNPYSLSGNHNEKYGFDWEKISNGLNKALLLLLNTGRLIGNLNNNNRVYKEQLKGIRPNLLSPYYTHRQIVGDEATKLAYYNRAALGESLASRAFTSDADRLMAYLMEAKRIGDELRALGDLADNLEIRRTSDESNAHEWSNILRATEVANANRASINNANALRHNLKALKYSADWTSIDNYLMSLEYDARKRLAEREAKQRQLDLLTYLRNLENDEKLLRLSNEANLAWEKSTYSDPSLDPVVKEKLRKLKNYLYDLLIRHLQTARRGTKITLKNSSYDDLLYKTSRDAAEHFVKMSKISSDALNRREVKILKLAAHPKNTRRKYQLGGVAPFTIYRPITFGGESQMSLEQSSSTSSNTSTKKDTSEKDKLDMIKELFKEIQGQGLPVDVNAVYLEFSSILNRVKAFGGEMSTDDIASMYLKAMSKVNNLKYSKGITDKARQVATEKDSLGEFAVDAMGNYVVLDKEGNISTASSLLEILEKKLNPITNEQLLNLRAYHPDLVLGKGDTLIDNVISNGMGINKISAYIKSLASSLGSSESKIDGLTKVESDKVKSGLEILAGAPDGHYKITTEIKQQLELVNAALAFIENSLTPSLKAILNAHGGTRPLIKAFLTSQLDSTYNVSIQPLTGKASDKDEKEESLEKIKSNPLMQMLLELGGIPRTYEIVTRDSNIKMSVDGTYYSLIPKITEDTSIDKMLSESGFAGVSDRLGITFGDLNISPDLFKDIMYSNSGGMVVTLPCKIVNGHKEVNLGVRKTYEEAIQEVESKGISKNSKEYYKVLGEVLKQKGLNSLLDSNGYPDRNKFGQFLVVEAYTTDRIKNLDTSSQYIEKVKNPDALLEERMIKALSTDSKKSNYNLDIDYWLYGDDVYRGTVFIPLNNNLNAAINASGSLISVENAKELENKFQNFNKASNMKSSNSDVL